MWLLYSFSIQKLSFLDFNTYRARVYFKYLISLFISLLPAVIEMLWVEGMKWQFLLV